MTEFENLYIYVKGDSEFVMCGSDEGNIRLWKTVAWAKHGILNFRQKAALQYSEALKKKFKHHTEVKRIARHRHLPKNIYKERIKDRISKFFVKLKLTLSVQAIFKFYNMRRSLYR